MKEAFVTGATGLLGNHLVRALLADGYRVKALVRSRAKGEIQFGSLTGLELVQGDLKMVEAFAPHMEGCTHLFHTAAYFRESYGGGRHWEELRQVNVNGTRNLLEAASRAGIRRMLHASSIAVLDGPKNVPINETMERRAEGAEDYYRSKILTDRVVFEHLDATPEAHISIILPGWMHGPGDLGPTSAGQFTRDFLARALPGIPPATFSFVDARDVARAFVLAAEKGRRGERYLAAGHFVTAAGLMQIYEQVSGIPAPKRKLPLFVLRIVATMNEIYAKITGRTILLGLAAFRNIKNESGRTHFDHTKSRTELGVEFRPIIDTLRDEIAWTHDQIGKP